jgi:hypothetical protein
MRAEMDAVRIGAAYRDIEGHKRQREFEGVVAA